MYTNAKNPRFLTERGLDGLIGITIDLDDQNIGTTAYVTMAGDNAPVAKKLYDEIVAGDYGEIAPFNEGRVDEAVTLYVNVIDGKISNIRNEGSILAAIKAATTPSAKITQQARDAFVASELERQGNEQQAHDKAEETRRANELKKFEENEAKSLKEYEAGKAAFEEGEKARHESELAAHNAAEKKRRSDVLAAFEGDDAEFEFIEEEFFFVPQNFDTYVPRVFEFVPKQFQFVEEEFTFTEPDEEDQPEPTEFQFKNGETVKTELPVMLDWSYEDGEFLPPPIDHVSLKVEAIDGLEAIAESYRLRFIAAAAGKQAEYELKAQVAILVLTDPENPPQRALDVLQPEADALGITLVELATAINQKADLARRASGLISGAVVEGKAAIAALEDDDTLPDALTALKEAFIQSAEERFEALLKA